jgi:hypothetical protein
MTAATNAAPTTRTAIFSGVDINTIIRIANN